MQKAIHGITVAHFVQTYRDKLKLELVCGADGLHRLIREGSINRPALALTGFFLERHVLAPNGRALPAARSRLVDRLRA